MSRSLSNVSSYGGVGFPGLLTLIFITLKLLGIIAWSWWWVLSPLWITFSLVVIVLAVIVIVGLIFGDS